MLSISRVFFSYTSCVIANFYLHTHTHIYTSHIYTHTYTHTHTHTSHTHTHTHTYTNTHTRTHTHHTHTHIHTRTRTHVQLLEISALLGTGSTITAMAATLYVWIQHFTSVSKHITRTFDFFQRVVWCTSNLILNFNSSCRLSSVARTRKG